MKIIRSQSVRQCTCARLGPMGLPATCCRWRRWLWSVLRRFCQNSSGAPTRRSEVGTKAAAAGCWRQSITSQASSSSSSSSCLFVLTHTNSQRRLNGGGEGVLAPAMLKPWGREYLFAPAIFSHIFACCSVDFHSLSLCCRHTIKTSHSVGTTGRILRNKLTKHTSPANRKI